MHALLNLKLQHWLLLLCYACLLKYLEFYTALSTSFCVLFNFFYLCDTINYCEFYATLRISFVF